MSLTKDQRAAISRANGAKSRGPKTSEGKAISSKNALKYGVGKTAKKIILDKLESESDYKKLAGMMKSNHKPTDVTQALLVDRITSLWWRLARVGKEEALLIWEEGESPWANKEAPHYLIQNREEREALMRHEESIWKQIQSTTKELERLQQLSSPPSSPSSRTVDISPPPVVLIRERDSSDD